MPMEGIMRTSLTLLVFAIALVAAPTHRFACSDYMQGKVFIVDAEGKVEGSYDAPNSNDVWALPNGNLLLNAGNGVRKSRGTSAWCFPTNPAAKSTPASGGGTVAIFSPAQ